MRRALQEKWADEVLVLDALTYAGNFSNLESVTSHRGFRFERCNVAKPDQVDRAWTDSADAVFHLAAESHVDRSIHSAHVFVESNVVGTQVMLDAARKRGVGRFVHVSTDEVYGSLELDSKERFVESSTICPTSPYAASKAAADMLVLAAFRTHGIASIVTRCSNNFGPYQFPEKFIPLFVTNAFEGKPLPLYGDGKNVRDWIHVEDHVLGLKLAFEKGQPGEVYNLGGDCERDNRSIAARIVEAVGVSAALITPVEDRKAHDRRYAIDPSKAKRDLGFVPGPSLDDRLNELVDWYRTHRVWWETVKRGDHVLTERRTQLT